MANRPNNRTGKIKMCAPHLCLYIFFLVLVLFKRPFLFQLSPQRDYVLHLARTPEQIGDSGIRLMSVIDNFSCIGLENSQNIIFSFIHFTLQRY